MNTVTIYHNPACGTSRNTLALIRNAGIEPTIILYLETPPTHEKLRELIAQMGLSIREVIRTNVDPYTALNIADETLTDEELIDFMVKNPILINRPIVETQKGTRLCRPLSEIVLEILPSPQKGAFSKEDGIQIIDENGNLIVK
ncbi:MAG: arsenate reductase (glutaredoxin) [Saezia sp.]